MKIPFLSCPKPAYHFRISMATTTTFKHAADASHWPLTASTVRGAEDVVDLVVEQVVTWLPERVEKWVQYHSLASLEEEVQLVEDHFAAYLEAGEPPSAPFLSLSFFPFPSLSLHFRSRQQFPQNQIPKPGFSLPLHRPIFVPPQDPPRGRHWVQQV